MTLGDKIRFFRRAKGYTQENMADELHISVTAYGEIERNNSDISYSRLIQISSVLDVPVWMLLGFGDKTAAQLNGSFQNYIVDSQVSGFYTGDQNAVVHELATAKLKIEFLEKEIKLKDQLIEALNRS